MFAILFCGCYDPVFGIIATLPENPTYEADLAPLWQDACAGCHVGGVALGGLDLDAGYDALVDASAVSVPDLALVAPGDPEGSYLLYVLRGQSADVGGTTAQMPQGGPFFDEATLAAIENWIVDGAQP